MADQFVWIYSADPVSGVQYTKNKVTAGEIDGPVAWELASIAQTTAHHLSDLLICPRPVTFNPRKTLGALATILPHSVQLAKFV